MELTHRCLTPYDAWYVELKFVNAFFQIYEDNIRQNLKLRQHIKLRQKNGIYNSDET